MSPRLEEIRALEAASLAAWPPAERVELDGWLLCAAGGYTRRTNSVQPLAEGGLDLGERIGRCEAFYRGRGRPAIFKLTEAARPAGLEAALARRGYRREGETSVQVLALDGAPRAGTGEEVALRPALDGAWFAFCARMHGIAGSDREALRGILARVPGPRAFASVRDAGAGSAMLAQGLGVVVDGRALLLEMATAERARGRGLASRVMGALLDWARSQQAHQAFLQVVVGNAPAERLYARLGFREAYRYWYRAARSTALSDSV